MEEEHRKAIDELAECLELVIKFTDLCLNHPEAKEHRVWRKGLYMALERAQKILYKRLKDVEDKEDTE